MKSFARYREITNKGLLQLSLASRVCRDEKQALVDTRRILEDTRGANDLARGVARDIQARVCGCVAGVVSRCLEAVFDEPYNFKMDFVEKRGRTEVALTFERDGQIVDPMSASGGGVVDVASFALRLAAILLSGPKTRRILVLDEPFKFLSRAYRSKIRQLLSDLASEMSVQIIMVTHIDELQTGTIVEVGI